MYNGDRDLPAPSKAPELGLTEPDGGKIRARSTLSLAALAARQTTTVDESIVPTASRLEGSVLSRLWQGSEDSFKTTLLQMPTTAVAQAADRFDGNNREDRWSVYKSINPNPEFGTAEWLGHVAGSVAATGLEMGLLYRFVGPGAAAKLERSVHYGSFDLGHMAQGVVGSTLKETGLFRLLDQKVASDLTKVRLHQTAVPSLAKSMATGVVLGGVFTPNSPHSQEFGTERLLNAGFMGLGFGAQTAAAMKLKTLGVPLFKNDIVAGTAAAGLASEVDTDGRSLITKHQFADSGVRLQTLASSMLGGGLGGAFNSAHEFVLPTTGARGFRTLQDMIDAADSTRLPNYKDLPRVELPPKEPKADELMNQKDLTWDQKSVVALRVNLEDSGLHEEAAKDLVRDLQAALLTAKAGHKEPGEDHPKTITGYGGVRPGADDFDYHLARYFGGLVAQKGWIMVSGGAQKPGPTGGSIMEALNRGAFEAGGESWGVVVTKLAREKTTHNPYLTKIFYHPNFPTRKGQLRMSDETVVFKGGIGSVDEFVEKMVLQQTGKESDHPIYAAHPDLYDPFKSLLKGMERENLVNQRDADRFVTMPDVRKIIADIERRDMIKAGIQPPRTGLRALTGRFADLFSHDANTLSTVKLEPTRPIQAVQAAAVAPEASIPTQKPH